MGNKVFPILLIMSFRVEYTPPRIKYSADNLNSICQRFFDQFLWDKGQFENAVTARIKQYLKG